MDRPVVQKSGLPKITSLLTSPSEMPQFEVDKNYFKAH